MKPLTEKDMDLLVKNGAACRADAAFDPWPVVRLFTPDGSMVWLVAALDPDDGDTAYGLADLGDGRPETGIFSLTEVGDVRGRLGLGVDRDALFKPDKPLGRYAHQAEIFGKIIT